MLRRSFGIEKYDWHVDFFFAITHYEQLPIVSIMEEMDAPRKVMQRVVEKMTEGKIDTGFTYSNPYQRRSIVVIGHSSRGAQFLNSFTHELRHLTDDIAIECGMKMAGEEAAYLTGDVAMKVADIVCDFSCNHCHHNNSCFT